MGATLQKIEIAKNDKNIQPRYKYDEEKILNRIWVLSYQPKLLNPLNKV
jgi:hypothetical protein